MGFLPDEPNWVVYLFLALGGIATIICTFFWDYVIAIVLKRKYNWGAWQVMHYLCKWTRLRSCYVQEIEEKLRQAALDGKIRVWAILNIVGPYLRIDAEKFAEFTFDLRYATRKPDLSITSPPQFVPKIYEEGHRDNFLHKEIYYDPWFNGREIKRVWRRQWFQTLWHWVRGEKRNC